MELRLGYVQSIGENSFNILLSALACLLVLGLQQLGVPPVPASGLITFVLVVSLSILNIGGACGPAVLCGSFAGMSFLPDLLPALNGVQGNLPWILFALLLSTAVGFVYLLTQILSDKFPRGMLNGFGGKLGATAFAATLLCTYLTRLFLGIPISIHPPTSNEVSVLLGNLSLLDFGFSILASMAGAVLPILLTGKELLLIPLPVRQKSIYQLTANSKVMGIALLGFAVGGPLLLIPQAGQIMAASWYMGTFVSMTALSLPAPNRFKLLAGTLAPVFLWILQTRFHGTGGLLGLAALLSVFTIHTVGTVGNFVLRRTAP